MMLENTPEKPSLLVRAATASAAAVDAVLWVVGAEGITAGGVANSVARSPQPQRPKGIALPNKFAD